MKTKSLGLLFTSIFLVLGLVACGKDGSNSEQNLPQNHEHSAEKEWSSDETSHWHKCSECDEKLDKADHTFTDWTTTKEATCTEKGLKYKECSICKYKVEQVIPELGHKYKEAWSYDEHNHWHECEHDNTHKTELEEHTFGEWAVVKAATCEEKGLKEKTCKCGYKISEEVPALKHKYSRFDLQNLTIHEEKAAKLSVFCENDESHKLEFELPSVSSGAYESVLNYEGNCLTKGITTFYKLKNTHEIRKSLKTFTSKLSNEEDFFTDLFNLEFNKDEGHVLTKHNKLMSAVLVEEPTIHRDGKLELTCECGEKITTTVPALFFGYYDVTYPTSTNTNTIFTRTGFDITSFCEENFFEYNDVLEELKTKKFEFVSPMLPTLEIEIKEFNPDVVTDLYFKYRGQKVSKRVSFAALKTEPEKFEERLVLNDKTEGIGKIADRFLYAKYDSVCLVLENEPGILNHPNLKDIINNSPIVLYENQSLEQVEHLIPKESFKEFTIVDPTAEKTGKLIIQSNGEYKEEYILPKLTLTHYLHGPVNDCNSMHDEYYVINAKVLNELLTFSFIRNDHVTQSKILNHHIANSQTKYKHNFDEYSFEVTDKPNFDKQGTLNVRCPKCGTIKYYTIPLISTENYEATSKDRFKLKQSTIESWILPQMDLDFSGTHEQKIAAIRTIEIECLEKISAVVSKSASSSDKSVVIKIETEISKVEIDTFNFTYDENAPHNFVIEFNPNPNKACLVCKQVKMSYLFAGNLLDRSSDTSLSLRDTTSFYNVVIGTLDISDAEMSAHRTVAHDFFIQSLVFDPSKTHHYTLDASIICRKCRFNHHSIYENDDFMGPNDKIDVEKTIRCIISPFNYIDLDYEVGKFAFNQYLDNYPNDKIHSYLPYDYVH